MLQMLVAALVRGAPICAARAPREKPAPRRFPSALARARSRWVALIFAVGLLLGGGPWRWGSLAAAHARALGADADQGSSLVTSRQTTPESSSPIGQAPEACGPAPGACALEPADAGAAAAAPLAERSRVTLHFFWAVGCPHCEQAKPFLERLRRQRPGLVVEAIEVRQDPAGRARFFEVVRRLGIATFGVPLFVVGERYVTGFVPGETEPQVEALVDAARGRPQPEHGAVAPGAVETRWFGRLSVEELGLPVFTIALGLIDGFNPCAMWVLVFLLATLAGQRDRVRMALTAATFVVVSGVVYFAFMAAWLSVFLVVGMTRTLQVVLGSVALVIGAVNVKDFVALGRGPSLSIPAAAKPGIYARVRAALREHSLTSTLLGIATLALLVNFVELLCTAGLPAIYTSVLSQHALSTGERLGYLALYNLAYVADDALMVTVAVVTLSRRRLAERAGRWLKLLSGSVMVVLGLLLLFRPEALP